MNDIENLTQLKEAIRAGRVFQIVLHPIRDYVGQKRKLNVSKRNGVYLIDPDHVSFTEKANIKDGYWLSYGSEGDWTFSNGLCFRYNGIHIAENLVMAFRFLEETA